MAHEILYLTRADVEETDVRMIDIINALDTTFKEKGNGRYEMPPKPGIHPGQDSFMHAMPGYVPYLKAAGIKWVSGNPNNQAKGLPYISGLLILNDPDTGMPLAIMDATWITAKRTGAASAVAGRYLARADSARIGIIACGVQGRSHLEAFNAIFNLNEVRAYDIDPGIARAYAAEMSEALGLDVQPAESPREAVQDMDIVVTSGPILKDPDPVIKAGWLAPGGFASPVDFDSYWTGDALREMDRIVTDDVPQMEYYRSIGFFRETPAAHADLGDIASGSKPGRENDSERIAAINLGIALDDMTTAMLIYTKAREKGIGTRLPL